jgi:hypothetical protein
MLLFEKIKIGRNMKLLILFTLLYSSIFAQEFSKSNILGFWEFSSAKPNSSISFGKYIGQKRGEVLTIAFNPQGRLKVLSTGDVYNYEIINGELKIYESKFYNNNYEIKQKNRYDLMQIVGQVEGCYEVQVIKKKIPGLKSRDNYKACKIQEFPQPTVQVSPQDYKF